MINHVDDIKRDDDPFTPREKRRIAAERQALNLRPWQVSPTETRGQPCPYPSDFVRDQWAEALELRRQMQAAKKAKRKVKA